MRSDLLDQIQCETTDNGATSPPLDPIAEAYRIINEGKKARSKACEDDLAAALQKHRCSIEAFIFLRDGQKVIIPVNLIAMD